MKDGNTCEHRIAYKLTYLLIGGSIGAVLALLFAPKSGSELRGDIADASRRNYGATLEKANELKDRSLDVIRTVKDKTESAYEFASDKLASGKEVVTDAVSEAAGSVVDRIERIQGEPDLPSKQAGNGRKSTSIA